MAGSGEGSPPHLRWDARSGIRSGGDEGDTHWIRVEDERFEEELPIEIRRRRAWCQRCIGDPVDFGNGVLGEGNADRIDVDGGHVDWINDEEEVLGSDDIGAESTGDPGGSDDGTLLNDGVEA
jgi:hypothetical protein